MKISPKTSDNAVNICLDTHSKNKQALIFLSSKRNAEAMAERISKSLYSANLESISEKIRNTLSKPTKQCLKLSECVKKGVAFHHAGLATKQRELIEDNFREGKIKFIASTPTLAFGLNLPAFRVIIRDLKRFSRHGMAFIPVLEYHQMIGRAGRPEFEDYGEALTLASTKSELEHIKEMFILGEPEIIYSKLAVEPVFRTYVLSLIVSGVSRTVSDLEDFFSRSFYTKQYGDTTKVNSLIEKTISQLRSWGFIEGSDFVTASSMGNLKSTRLGTRVSELYLDPYTAHYLIKSMKKLNLNEFNDFSILQVFSNTLEMRPLLNVKKSEEELINNFLVENELLISEPNIYDPDYDEFCKTLKTGGFFNYWIEEVSEQELLEKFNIRPGEIHAKLNIIDWLFYSTEELSRIQDFKNSVSILRRLRLRLKYGVKEELLTLLKLKEVGRVRARKMYSQGIKTLRELRKADFFTLSKLLGEKTALKVKNQL